MTREPTQPNDAARNDTSQYSAGTSVRIPLSQLRRGERAVVDTRDLPEAESKLLAAMGMGERCEIRVCRAGTPCIVQIQAIRVGIGREVADRIITTPCGCAERCEAEGQGPRSGPGGS